MYAVNGKTIIFYFFQERTKALGYMTSNIRGAEETLQAMDETAAKRPPDNVNELHIRLFKCTGLKPRRERKCLLFP